MHGKFAGFGDRLLAASIGGGTRFDDEFVLVFLDSEYAFGDFSPRRGGGNGATATISPHGMIARIHCHTAYIRSSAATTICTGSSEDFKLVERVGDGADGCARFHRQESNFTRRHFDLGVTGLRGAQNFGITS